MNKLNATVVICASVLLGWTESAAAESPLGDMLTAIFVKQYSSCTGKVASGADAAGLRQVFPLRPDDITLQQLAIGTRPTASEVQLLANMHEQWVVCRTALLKRIRGQYPSEAALAGQGFAAMDQVWGALASGQATWGAANTARKRIAADFDAALAGEPAARGGNNAAGTYKPPSTTVGDTARAYTNQHLYGNEYISPSRQGTYQERW